MAARRKEAVVAQRRPQHRQLQPGDVARHLRWHLGVRQDLVEQAGDHIDHHVVERAGGGLPQLVAVGVDQVGRGQPRPCARRAVTGRAVEPVASPARQAAPAVGVAALAGAMGIPSTVATVATVAAVATEAVGVARSAVVGAARRRTALRQAADQGHHLAVDPPQAGAAMPAIAAG